jgi:hypothetical protein
LAHFFVDPYSSITLASSIFPNLCHYYRTPSYKYLLLIFVQVPVFGALFCTETCWTLA